MTAVPTVAGPPSLNISKSVPVFDIGRAKILLYGVPKIGKSTLASKFPGTLFLATEEGLEFLPVYKMSVASWAGFLETCGMLDKSFEQAKTQGVQLCLEPGVPLKTIVIDTADLLFKMCLTHVCNTMGVGDPSDLEWGKGWNALSDEFSRVICKITRWGVGLVFISHAIEKEVKSRARKIDRVQPAVMTTGLKVLSALCDMLLYCYMDEEPEVSADGELTGRILEQRSIRCVPQNNVMAGDRTGRLPAQIPLSYDALVSYFAQGKEVTESDAKK